MKLAERLHFYHRAWRYRLRTERDELAFVRQHELRGATVLDIGANRGIYSYWLHRQVGPAGHVIAFEPQPELCVGLDRLKSALALKRLTIVPSALSSACGQAQLMRPHNHWGGASLTREATSPAEMLSVATTTLDAFFAHHPQRPIKFIKCDVEGHELACLRGGERLLAADRPTLLLEATDAEYGPLASFLQPLGYAAYFLYRRQKYPVADLPHWRARLRPLHLNYVFEPEIHRARRAA